MKKLLENKKVAVAIALLLFLVVIFLAYFLTKEDNKENKTLKEKTYTMYVKINPLVKLTFKETYYECKDDKGNWSICSDTSNEVIEYNMLNNDAKEVYDKIDFKGKTVEDSLVILCDVARDNDIGFESLEITSDYNFDTKKIAEEIKNESKYDTTYNVFVDFEEHIDEQEVIDNNDEEPLVTYKVKFDANGGSIVDDVVVRENDVVLEPAVPTKKGYEFVSWQLNGKNYSFTSKVTKNITLKAKWKKVEDKDPQTDTPNTSSDEQVTKDIRIENIEFKNVKNGLEGYIKDGAYIVATITGPKSFISGTKNAELLKLISVVVDLNGKDVGDYDLPFKVSIAKEGVKITAAKKSIKVIVRKAIDSKLDKINLNDNILINEKTRGIPCKSTYIFSDNATTVLAKYKVQKNEYERKYPYYINADDYDNYQAYSDAYAKEYERLGKEWKDALTELTYNSTKATNASKEIKQILSSTKGINNYTVGDDPKDFGIEYGYLYISNYDSLGKFGEDFNEHYEDIKDKVNAVFDKYGMIVLSEGACGGGGDDPKLLTEEICKEYNLNCSRW